MSGPKRTKSAAAAMARRVKSTMPDHTVKSFTEELDGLTQEVSRMGGLAEMAVNESIASVVRRDTTLAQGVIERDARIDAAQHDIEKRAIKLFALRQPMASDLRVVLTGWRIAGELERVGDLAKNIAKRAVKIAAEARLPRAIVGLKSMHEFAAIQLKDVLDAYAQRDVERARAVWMRDAELDALEDSVFRDLLTFMMEDPRNITFCTHLLFCAKNLERIGDHVTNVAENAYYVITGSQLPPNRPKIDETAMTAMA